MRAVFILLWIMAMICGSSAQLGAACKQQKKSTQVEQLKQAANNISPAKSAARETASQKYRDALKEYLATC